MTEKLLTGTLNHKTNKLTWSSKHVQHSLCDSEASANIDTGDKTGHGGQDLYVIGRQVTFTH